MTELPSGTVTFLFTVDQRALPVGEEDDADARA
jgi:hypothetical protein